MPPQGQGIAAHQSVVCRDDNDHHPSPLHFTIRQRFLKPRHLKGIAACRSAFT